MLVLYVLCAVLESACGITNHVVVSLLLLFIEVCAVIYLQSMAGRTFAVTVYLLSFLVIKETSYGFPVVLYAVWEQTGYSGRYYGLFLTCWRYICGR